MAYVPIPIHCPECGRIAASFERLASVPLPLWVVTHLEKPETCVVEIRGEEEWRNSTKQWS